MTTVAATIALPRSGPSVLAVGAFLKNTVCVTKGDRAYLSPVHGDLGTPDSIALFEHSAEAMVRELGVKPVRVAHDLHPDFHSTRFAQALDLPALAVQHHHAHAAAIAAEHGHAAPILGLSLDGFGLGPENQAWGGELLYCEGADFRRLGHLVHIAQPGGDKAAREPWRMAAAWLHKLGRADEIASRWKGIPAASRLGMVLDKGLNAPITSSAGRLFDAACGLLGVHPVAEFEGQAPMALEALVDHPAILASGWILERGVLDFAPLMSLLASCPEPRDGANLFHGTLIAGLADWCVWGAESTGCRTIALGGGCFFNRVLTAGLVPELERRGLVPLTATQASPGDAGLSLGQAWIAALREM
ncbi:hydrogenase maturation protein HypF [Magnetospirillum moscoviense]|uniref:Hydrogenase maturation protein HypF n=1 Tax=Magnetospirillum moscoviense TaxID=1437059 RepID=A0A178MGX9_9PROT|nr:hydrogenase maturation protein HypF [Magnetospirillum moscoviense]OAN47916.1 hydrogenase maturation protein HypF [Magnetospirillum moscoviense]